MNRRKKTIPIVIVGAGGMGRDTQWLIERINEAGKKKFMRSLDISMTESSKEL